MWFPSRRFQPGCESSHRMHRTHSSNCMVVSGMGSGHCACVKTILTKPASSSAAADAEVRQLQAAGKRIAANKKSILRFLAATGMYSATGKLKPQFR